MTSSSPANTHPDDHLWILGCSLLSTASGAKKSNCNLMPANLVPLVLAAVKKDPNLQPGTLAPFVEGYVRDVWGPAKLGRLKEAARTKLGIGNDAKADTSQIQAVVESLRECGWMAERFTMSGTEMQTVAVEANRGKWKWRENTRKKANKQYIQVALNITRLSNRVLAEDPIPGDFLLFFTSLGR